jgi:fibronectin-binding autotransporter adhesin
VYKRQGQASDPGKIATVNNSGTLGGGTGILLGGPGGNALGGAVITNSGTIEVTVSGQAIFSGFSGLTTISNLVGATLSGRSSGIIGRDGAIAVTNAGTIIGQAGGNNGGIVIEQAGSSVSNSGLIQSFNFGVTANPYAGQPRAVGTVVENSGTIRGLNNDGVRLQGGGTVTNSGLMEGLNGAGADGVSMFSLPGQNTASITSIGTITNLAGGRIRGNRFGIILSNGGTIDNAGSIWAPDANSQTFDGRGTGIVIQDGENIGNKIAIITNSGDISGGNGIGFASAMPSANITNSGSITGRTGDGINSDSNAMLNIDNLASGSITGARSGVYAEWGPLALTNAGNIRGNGTNGNFTRTDAGVVIVQPGSTVDNSGSITGARFGITTTFFIEDVTENYLGLASGTAVTNSGTIRGENDDGVRLIGGGTVTNSGLIEGLASSLADGVSMFAFDTQDLSAMASIGTVTNFSSGTICGNRFGVILSGGGLIENDGTIRGNANGLLIQAGNAQVPYTGTLINRGTIENGARFNDGLTASVTNSGTISIDSPNTPALDSLAQISVVNTGTISSTGTHAIRFGLGNDLLTLGTGSQIIGISDGGAGLDILRLQSGAGVTQALGRFDGFETLETISGAWTVAGDSGTFNAIAITGGELILTGSIAGVVTTSGSGTFRLGSGTGVGGFTGDIVNDGNLLVDIGTSFDITGDFSGTGNFTKSGVGTVSFLGAYGFTGTTTLLAGGIRIAGAIDPQALFDLGGGTLDLSGSTGTTIAGLSGDAGSRVVLGSSNLTVNQDIDTVFAGNLSGTGSLIKDGDGRLNLTGASTYTGPTIISGGTLSVNGSIVSPVTIQSGATLGGTGTTGTVTIESGGTFNPGNSIGTIRVIGPLTFRSGSTFAVETSPTGSSDRINVTGRITIDSGAAMSVLAGTGNYRPSTTYVVLTATDRVAGKFGSVSTDLAFLEPKLDYSSKKVELTLKRRNVSFASVAKTSSQAAVASAVESLGLYNPLFDGVLNQNASGARSAFEALSGGFYGQISNRLLVGGSRIQDALQEGGDPAANGPHIWTTALSGARTGSGPEYRSGFSLARDGLQFSLVTGYLPFERLGSGQRGSANVETHYSGMGASYTNDGWTVGTGFGVAWHSIEANRAVAFAGFADGARSEFRAMTRQAFGELSYRADLGSLAVSPFAGLSTSRMSGADITETGGAASLSILSRERQLNLATLGVRASGNLALPKGLRLIPRVELGWQWAGGDLGAMQSTRFLRNGAGFNIIADALSTNGLTADVGLELQMGNVSLLGTYQRNAIARDAENGAQLGLRMRF